MIAPNLAHLRNKNPAHSRTKKQNCTLYPHASRQWLYGAFGNDDGLTWSDMHVIEDGSNHGYCYPAAFFTDDGTMLVAYCASDIEDSSCLARLTIMKILIEKDFT